MGTKGYNKRPRIGGKYEWKRTTVHFWRPNRCQKVQQVVYVSHEDAEPLYRDVYRYYEVPIDDEEALPFMRQRLCQQLRTTLQRKRFADAIDAVLRDEGLQAALAYLAKLDTLPFPSDYEKK